MENAYQLQSPVSILQGVATGTGVMGGPIF